MCDSFLASYASEINASGVDNLTIPTVIGFTQPNCTGRVINIAPEANVRAVIRSLYVPAGYTNVKFKGTNPSCEWTVNGPYLIPDLAVTPWPNETPPPFPTQVMFGSLNVLNYVAPTTEDYLLKSCTESPYEIGPHRLFKYAGSSPACDTIMKTFCARTPQHPQCICLTEEAKYTNTELPMTCFSQTCGSSRSYRTGAMERQPCNITYCQQKIVQEGKGIDLTDYQGHVYCGGSYILKVDVSVSTSSLTSTSANESSITSPWLTVPYYWYIIIGVAGVICWLLVYFLFRDVDIVAHELVGKHVGKYEP